MIGNGRAEYSRSSLSRSRHVDRDHLRALDDSKTIRSALEQIKQAVVIGGGFIGMEVAAVLAQKGIEVTMVLNDDRIWKRLFSREMSSFFEAYYAERGVRVVKSTAVAELQGNGVVNSAVLRDGQTVPCELVIAGIGVQPAIEMIKNSGTRCGGGRHHRERIPGNQPNRCVGGG